MNKLQFLTQIIPALAMLIGAISFISNIDKKISISEHRINSMTQEIRRFEKAQYKRNEKQDNELMEYRKYFDEKINQILNTVQKRSC